MIVWRGRVGPHKIELKKFVGWTVLDIQTDDRDELKGDIIRTHLKKVSFKSVKLAALLATPHVAEPERQHEPEQQHEQEQHEPAESLGE